MADLTTETARAIADGRLDDAVVLADAAVTIHNMLAEHAARQIAYYTERFLNCQARGLDLRDVETPPDGWSEPAPAPAPAVANVQVQAPAPDPMKCCPGKWKHDVECVPCRFCFGGTRQYRGDGPICADCLQQQASRQGYAAELTD